MRNDYVRNDMFEMKSDISSISYARELWNEIEGFNHVPQKEDKSSRQSEKIQKRLND